MKPIFGRLIVAGEIPDDPEIASETITGLIVEVPKEDLRAMKTLPLYQRVVIIPADNVAALERENAELRWKLEAQIAECKEVHDPAVRAQAERIAELERENAEWASRYRMVTDDRAARTDESNRLLTRNAELERIVDELQNAELKRTSERVAAEARVAELENALAAEAHTSNVAILKEQQRNAELLAALRDAEVMVKKAVPFEGAWETRCPICGAETDAGPVLHMKVCPVVAIPAAIESQIISKIDELKSHLGVEPATYHVPHERTIPRPAETCPACGKAKRLIGPRCECGEEPTKHPDTENDKEVRRG